MRISFTPQRRDETLTLSRAGDILTINGEAFDFSVIPDGATLPAEAVACDLIAGDVERIGGAIRLRLILPHAANPTPEQQDPADIVEPDDGPVPIPENASPAEEEQLEALEEKATPPEGDDEQS